MTPGLIERHHDYVLGPNQDGRLASVAAGQTIQGITLSLDADAPFQLRSRALRVAYDANRLQTGLNHVLMQWAGPDRNFRSQDFIRQSLCAPYVGQLGNPIPNWPQPLYPRNGVIAVNVKNDGATALTNLTFYFRGVKLFAPGSVRSFGYPMGDNGVPHKISTLPFVLPQTCSLAATQGPKRFTLLNQYNKPISDADFVILGAEAGNPFSTTPVNEVFITLLDEDEKPYSNDAVHVDVIFGNSCFGNTYPVGTSTGIPPVGAGPQSGGLFYPQLYIPRNHIMYYDLSRSDGSYAGATTVNFQLAFQGYKVFDKGPAA